MYCCSRMSSVKAKLKCYKFCEVAIVNRVLQLKVSHGKLLPFWTKVLQSFAEL